MGKQLNTVGEVIEELGGHQVVEEMTAFLSKRRPISRVPMWKNRNRFPPKSYTVLQRALQKRGKTAPALLWGMP
jgi:hypothetical protein